MVVVKETDLILLKQPELALVKQEAAILSTLNHPNIVKYLGDWITSDQSKHFLITEYAEHGKRQLY